MAYGRSCTTVKLCLKRQENVFASMSSHLHRNKKFFPKTVLLSKHQNFFKKKDVE